MSRYGIEKACYDLADEWNSSAFKQDPGDYLSRYPLEPAEREEIEAGDVGALYLRDVSAGALSELMRVFDYDMADYVVRLRRAAGMSDDQDQLRILRERAQGRKRFS